MGFLALSSCCATKVGGTILGIIATSLGLHAFYLVVEVRGSLEDVGFKPPTWVEDINPP